MEPVLAKKPSFSSVHLMSACLVDALICVKEPDVLIEEVTFTVYSENSSPEISEEFVWKLTIMLETPVPLVRQEIHIPST
jgi:hypothetical protein